MGVNGTHNTVEGNVDAYNTVCVKAVAEYVPIGVQGTVPGIMV